MLAQVPLVTSTYVDEGVGAGVGGAGVGGGGAGAGVGAGVGGPLYTSQASPLKKGESHTHRMGAGPRVSRGVAKLVQLPLPLQSSGHCGWLQSAPPYPAMQTHAPATQEPRPLHWDGQG